MIAMFKFLTKKGEDNMEYFIALIPSGIAVLRNKMAVANYSW